MAPGTQIGPYQIIASIGAGGMGEVFRARDTRLNRNVAIKVLPKDFASDTDRMRRFEQEAQTLAALNHPNILTIHDAGVHAGAPYLVSELLEGRTLRDETHAGTLPSRQASNIALQIANGLAAAHDKGIIHRDLKPENLFVTTDGRLKILDFGLAKLGQPNLRSPISDLKSMPEQADTVLQRTEVGIVLGTPAYMSPEQVRGEPADHRADIFAFGCVLYEMLTGKRAFRRNTAVESMNAVLNEAPPELTSLSPAVPPALTRIVERCLEKQPDKRFQSAKDLAFAIESASAHSSATAWAPPDVSPRWRQPRGAYAIAVVVLAAAGLGWWFVHDSGKGRSAATAPAGPSTAPAVTNAARIADQKSVAVLPFTNISADKENEYFSDGITEEILNALARTPGLRVAARTSAFSFKGRNESVRHIAEALNVGVVLEGSVRRAGNQLRITAQLINAADGFQLWSTNFDRKAEDVFAIQSEVAQKVQEVLQVKLLGGSPRSAPAGTDNLEAYDLYLRGRHFWNLRTGTDAERALGMFQQATEKDSNFAEAYAGLASSYVLLPNYASVPTREAIPKARMAARRALDLDERLAEAHAVLGHCAQVDWDWDEAEREYQQALRLNPNHATSHHWYSVLLFLRGRPSDGMAEVHKALELDPLSVIIRCSLGQHHFMAGRFDEASAEFEEALKLSPDFPPALVGRGFLRLRLRHVPKALAAFETIRQKTGDTPYALGYLGFVYARIGRTNEARQVLEKLKTFSAAGVAASPQLTTVSAALGDLDQAFVWLERAAQTREVDPRALKNDPIAGDIPKDPRYAALLKKFGLDK